MGQAAREHITDAGESQLAALVEGLGDASEETALPPLAIGDVVVVTEGDLVNLTGKVQAVHESGQVDVLPDMLELSQAVPIPARQLAKNFEVRLVYLGHQLYLICQQLTQYAACHDMHICRQRGIHAFSLGWVAI